MSADEPRQSAGTIGRSRARLAAVQALYQIELDDTPVEDVIDELASSAPRRRGRARRGRRRLLGDIVRGTVRDRDELDGLVERDAGTGLAAWHGSRRCCARSCAPAPTSCWRALDMPARVVINEYVDIAHAFFAGKEPGFVNGVLDRVGRRLRPGELRMAKPPRLDEFQRIARFFAPLAAPGLRSASRTMSH